ncbi:MAG: YggT family protein [Gemmatimonadales bacterium]
MIVLAIVRIAVFLVFFLSAVVALASWAVRSRRIDPFSSTGQLARRFTDPMIQPFERWLLQRGGNPQIAPWWLLGAVIAGGIVVVTLTQWLVVQSLRMAAAGAAGPRGILRLVVLYSGQIVSLALFVRVIGSWFGMGRYNRWMRYAYRLTDWLVEPLRRIIPPFGAIDATPLVAWFLLQFLIMPLVLGILR